MAGQRGRDVLIKLSDGQVPEAFSTIAGIRTSEFELNAQSVDGTAMDSVDGWRELLAGAGLKSARVRGRGVFKDTASDQRMRALFFNGELSRWCLIIPGMGQLLGAFHIRGLKWGGTYDGEATFSIDLESAGPLTFEAAS